MNGAKRLALADSNSNADQSIFQSERMMGASYSGVQRAEPFQQQLMASPPFDMRRAESSRQHVRALNTQFASWIQSQLQNHPDELWEDGVQDYLAHASSIMDKFSDVVKWLKANQVNGESSSAIGSHVPQKQFGYENRDKKVKVSEEKIGFAPSGTTASFAPSWSSGALFNGQTPFSFGNQNSVISNRDASNNADDEDEAEQPSSPSVKKTEEEGISVVHEVKCKLYVKSSDPADKDAWKDKGTGQLSIKCKEGVSKGTKESKPTILVRNDVGRLLLNALLYPGIKTSMQKNSIVAIFHTSGDNDGSDNNSVMARTFLIRTRNEEDRNKLAAAIQEYAPAA